MRGTKSEGGCATTVEPSVPPASAPSRPVTAGGEPAAPAGSPKAFGRFWKRRRFLVDPALQSRFMLGSMFTLALFFLVTLVAMFLPLVLELQTYQGTGSDAPEAAQPFLYLHGNFWLVLGFTLVTMTLLSLRTSHRVAGPLFRLRTTLKKVGKGQLPAGLRFRTGDYLVTMEPDINAMLEGLRETIRDTRQAQRELRARLATHRRRAQRLEKEELSRILDDLGEAEARLAAQLDRWQLEGKP